MAGRRRAKGIEETRREASAKRRRAALLARMAQAHTPADQVTAAALYYRSMLTLARSDQAAASTSALVDQIIAAADALPLVSFHGEARS